MNPDREAPANRPLRDLIKNRKLLFVGGKGGVGKTVVSQALAQALAQRGKKVLWVCFEDPTRKPGKAERVRPGLDTLNCDAAMAFEEYIAMKLKVAALARLFSRNPVIQFLAKAGPGVHELVLLGKLWHERQFYDHIVADMPSTGYGLAMFQSIENWSQLFLGGPLFKDAEGMLATFRSPEETGQIIVSLPEEMPLQESLEMRDFLLKLFPRNAPAMVVNRCFPQIEDLSDSDFPRTPHSPLAASAWEYAERRSRLERVNLQLWERSKIQPDRLDYEADSEIVESLSRQLEERYLS